jgi:hypothetical protein
VQADLRLPIPRSLRPPLPSQQLRLVVLFDDIDAGVCAGNRVLYPNQALRWAIVRQYLHQRHHRRHILGCVRATLQYGMPRIDFINAMPQPYTHEQLLQAVEPRLCSEPIDPLRWMPRAYLGIDGPLKFDLSSRVRLPSPEQREMLDRQALRLRQWPGLIFYRAALVAPWAMHLRPRVLLWDLAPLEPYVITELGLAVLPHLPAWRRQTLPGQVDLSITPGRYHQPLQRQCA